MNDGSSNNNYQPSSNNSFSERHSIEEESDEDDWSANDNHIDYGSPERLSDNSLVWDNRS